MKKSHYCGTHVSKDSVFSENRERKIDGSRCGCNYECRKEVLREKVVFPKLIGVFALALVFESWSFLTPYELKSIKTDYFSSFVQEQQTPQKDDKVYDVVDEMPQFQNGTNDLGEWIKENKRYPVVCWENGIEGKVTVTLIIERDGSVSNVKKKGDDYIDPALEKEALRLINSLPKWKPGKHNGVVVRVKYTIPVIFSLNE